MSFRELARWLVFQYAVFTGHDEFKAEAGTLKSRFLSWLYEGEAEPEFNVVMPDGDE